MATARACLMCKARLDPPAEPDEATQTRATPRRRDDPSATTRTHALSLPDDDAEAPRSALSGKGYDPSEVVAWLVCEPLEPIPVLPDAQISIGRSAECDVVLRHRSISRKQGIVREVGGSLLYQDLGSSNGTFVNGRRTKQAKLEPGDVLNFGPYTLEVHSNATVQELEDELDGEGTQVLEVSSITHGFLHEVPLGEVLQGIEFNQKSGTLRLISGELRGELAIDRGRPLRASFGGKTEDEAVLAMLALAEGRYMFAPELELGAPKVKGTITALLLEASRRADHGQ